MIITLANAVGYPEMVPEGASSFAFRIDDRVISAEKSNSRLVLRRVLDVSPDDLARFAAFAAGRMLREEAVLAWDERSEKAFLWREIPSGTDAAGLRTTFEDFCASCDWWDSRAGELHVPRTVFPDIMIYP